MIRFSKVRTVVFFEFISTIKRKSYLIATFGMPVFLLLYGGLVSAIGFFTHQADNRLQVYGVVDENGFLGLDSDVVAGEIDLPAAVRDALEQIGKSAILSGPLALDDQVVFRSFPDEAEARAALAEKVIAAYFLLPPDFVDAGRLEEYFSEGLSLPRGSTARDSLRTLILDKLLTGRVPEKISERVREPIAEIDSWTLNANGERTARTLASVIARLVVPIGFTMLLFVSLMISAGYLVQGLAIEKENKVVEILLASLNPEEILFGKLLGLGGAGLFQVLVWFSMIIFAGIAFAATLAAFGVSVPWLAMGVGLVLFVEGYLFLGSLMLGAGSLGRNQRESQQFAAAWTLLAVLPMMLMGLLLRTPHHPVALVMSWIPFTAPVTLLLRLSLDPAGIAWWEIAGSAVVLAASIWAALLVGARLFRVGLLLTGARPKLREILRQARLG